MYIKSIYTLSSNYTSIRKDLRKSFEIHAQLTAYNGCYEIDEDSHDYIKLRIKAVKLG